VPYVENVEVLQTQAALERFNELREA
jgi:hypothetical protein